MPAASPCGASETRLMATNLFAPVPLRSMALELSGLQMRVLTCVAAHDRMSLAKGKGQGCRASNERMREMIGCSYGKLCASLNELVAVGLLQREKLGRHTVYRVVYNDDDMCLFGHTKAPAIGDQTGKPDAAIGDHDNSETRRNADEKPLQYIPLNGGRDFVETRERNSDNRRDVAVARDPVGIICHLPKNFHNLPLGAQVAKVEAAFDVIDRDISAVSEDETTRLTKWLDDIFEGFGREPVGQHALRLLTEMRDDTL